MSRAVGWAEAAEALAMLCAASLAVRVLPIRWLLADGRTGGADGLLPVAAVRAVARRLRWRAACLEQGLALHWMGRRRGVATRLHYGLIHDGGGAMRGHLWVTLGQHAVLGGPEAVGFACVLHPQAACPR